MIWFSEIHQSGIFESRSPPWNSKANPSIIWHHNEIQLAAQASVRESVRTNNLLRSVAIAGLSLLLWLAFAPSRWRAQGAQSPTEFARSVQPFLASTCYMCHNAELKSGGLNLQALQTASSITHNREVWERVLRKLRAGEMPPKSLPRPNPEELKTVISWIQGEFERAD